jgi:drug/metabolite transporter (DMT)-like permease
MGQHWRILGGLIWICAGTILALRPGNAPGVSFRASTDVLPWLVLGLLLIAAMLYSLYRRQRALIETLGKWAAFSAIAGAILYALGHVARQFLAGGWEPAVPTGFLIFILSSFTLAIATLRVVVYPKRVGIALLFGAVFLLFFNDQFATAWSAVPFGLTCIVLGLLMQRHEHAAKD